MLDIDLSHFLPHQAMWNILYIMLQMDKYDFGWWLRSKYGVLQKVCHVERVGESSTIHIDARKIKFIAIFYFENMFLISEIKF